MTSRPNSPCRFFMALAFAAVLALAASAEGLAVTIKGSVKRGAGMRVTALARSGTAVSQKLDGRGGFRLTIPAAGARDATLQLVSANGSYFGPVVLRLKRRRAFTALGGTSVNVGRVVLRAGYAVATRQVPARFVDVRRFARADVHGKPVGAGKLGLVRGGKTTRSLAALARATDDGSSNPGADTDGDGIPNAVDADDNGNLVLDNVDSSDKGGGANGGLFSTINLPFERTLNVNAGGLTRDQIDGVVAGENMFNMIFFLDEGRFQGRTITGAHVDCGALVYCRRGDGTAALGGVSESTDVLPPRWVDYNTDGSGYPNLEKVLAHGSFAAWIASVQPWVGTEAVRPGDTYDVVFDTTTGPIHLPVVLSPYFVSAPALATLSSGGAAKSLVYPVASGSPGTSEQSPIQLDSGRLSVTFWRPQRVGIPGADTTDYVDLGHLHYGLEPVIFGSPPIGCKGYYSDLSGGLTEGTAGSDPFAEASWPLTDGGADAAPDPGHVLGFTIDLGGCLQAAGVNPAGKTIPVNLTAAGEPRPGGNDRAAQSVFVHFPG